MNEASGPFGPSVKGDRYSFDCALEGENTSANPRRAQPTLETSVPTYVGAPLVPQRFLQNTADLASGNLVQLVGCFPVTEFPATDQQTLFNYYY